MQPSVRSILFNFLVWKVIFLSLFLGSGMVGATVSLRTEASLARLDQLSERVLNVGRRQPLDLALAFPGHSRERAAKALIAPVNGSWRRNITSTLFWVGEDAGQNNPVHNHSSSWDTYWKESYGGTDSPTKRNGWFPASFVPKQTPFYVALPYNDLTRNGHRSEASKVIPWYWEKYRGQGVSVCHGQWLAIHKGGKICYARWMDVGPFTIDDWKYVFGGDFPRANRNGNAGIDISPAIRDYLGVSGMDAVDWSFIRETDVPQGPWHHGFNYKF